MYVLCHIICRIQLEEQGIDDLILDNDHLPTPAAAEGGMTSVVVHHMVGGGVMAPSRAISAGQQQHQAAMTRSSSSSAAGRPQPLPHADVQNAYCRFPLIRVHGELPSAQKN